MLTPLDDCGIPRVADSAPVPVLDPLQADDVMARLPLLNRQADVNGLVQAIASVLPVERDIERMTINETLAAVRDLGVLMASLKRHGHEPAEAIPAIESPMLVMGRRTHMIPRETVYHYSVWNPPRPRQRMFTGEPDEDVLIECSRMGARGVEQSVESLLAILEVPFESPTFVEGCRSAAHGLASMVDAINYTRESVRPEFFARVLRPYYEEITLGGHKYSGAAAAPLSIGVIDHLLWSSDCDDAEYREFQDRTMQYNMPKWKQVYRELMGRPSMATRLRRAVQDRAADSRLLEAVAAYTAVMRVILEFRGRHRRVALSAYREELRLYPVGSAGFAVATLDHILKLTHDINLHMRGAKSHPTDADESSKDRETR